MNSLRSCFFFAVLAPLSALPTYSQSPTHYPVTTARTNSVISVDELAMSSKALRSFEKGATLLLKGDAQASLPFFQSVIKEAPRSFRAYHNLGLAFYLLGQFDPAAQNLQKSIDLTNGAFAPSLFAFSMILYRNSEFRQAEVLIRQGLYAEPASAVGKYCLGLVQYSLGLTADAQISAMDAIALDPKETDAYLLLAHTHERQHNLYAVVADIQNYLRIDPGGPLQPDALALLHRAQQTLSPQSHSASLH